MINLIIDSVPRSFRHAKVEKFNKQVTAGGTKVYADVTVAGEESYLRFSHETAKNTLRHYVSLENDILQATSTEPVTDSKVGITLQHIKGNAASRQKCIGEFAALCAWLAVPGNIAMVMENALDLDDAPQA